MKMPRLSVFFLFRPLGLELCACSEVATLDRAPVPAAAGQRNVSGADREGSVLHDRSRLQTTLLAVWRHAVCSSGHLEIW